MEFVIQLVYLVIGLAIGGALGFYFTRKHFEKELKENPPVNEKMIRAMFLQMGRKPSEAQIKQVMKAMGAAK
ncbi:MAG: YneF family protein [Erysipelotrichaceae bacterium]|nr:YneF family protein [Erysipelotrichaceae bacterium]